MANRWHWVAVFAAAASVTAGASTLSVADCFEGSDFIAHAALARDNGMSRDAFMGRLEEDLLLIHAFPPALRWFAKDDADEVFLTLAAREVFDTPDTPEGHRARFLASCLGRSNV